MKARATAGLEVDLSQRAALVFMIAILLIVFGFGAGRLDWDGIDTDELATLSGIGVFGGIESSLQVMELVQQQNANHVPLYFYLCAFWAKLAGIGQFQLRLLSLLLGALSIAGLYRLAADLLDRRAGLVAALLMGANALVFTELHDMRMYSLLLLLTAAHFWLYWQLAIKGRGGRIRWIFFIISCSAIFYTHNLAAAWVRRAGALSPAVRPAIAAMVADPVGLGAWLRALPALFPTDFPEHGFHGPQSPAISQTQRA